jgi:CheY-like chemotaxis protein
MSHARTSILVVEDDPDTQLVISLALLNAGYNVHSVESRDAGLLSLPQLLPDLIVMDYRMEGLELGAFISKARIYLPCLHFILLSANATEIAQQSGIKYWLQKPFELEDLKNVVAACLRGGSSALMPAVQDLD